LFRECLARVLSQSKERRAEPVPHDAESVTRILSEAAAKVLFVDLNLPEGTTLRIIQEAAKGEMKVIVLVPDEHEKLIECIAAGAHGCVLERSTLDELTPAIDSVLRGQSYCSTEVVHTLYHQLKSMSREVAWRKNVPAARLTARESEVLELMAERLSNKQIARKLSVSLYTVKNHVHNILEKLQVESRMDAILGAREQRLIP
jgi:two-component system nitrate/nitrite response regulator NarL